MKMLTEEKLRKMKERAYRNKLRSYKRHLIRQAAKRERQFAVNRNLQLIEASNRIGSLRNCLRWYAGESKGHILKKLEICLDLKQNGHEFLTEAIFKNGKRCDVVDLTEGVVYEVLCTENEKSYQNKTEKYPKEFRIVNVNC